MAVDTFLTGPVEALIFDMDGTMIDSMPWHAKAWVEYARRRNMTIDVPDLMRRTTGRTAVECARELMQREVTDAESAEITHEKELIYRELFAAEFREVGGFNAFAKATVARGLKIAVGTDAPAIPHGKNADELVTLVDWGLPPLAVLRAATITAADLINSTDRGRLAEGLLADVIAVPGNPLEDIGVTQKVSFVMKGGKVFVN